MLGCDCGHLIYAYLRAWKTKDAWEMDGWLTLYSRVGLEVKLVWLLMQ